MKVKMRFRQYGDILINLADVSAVKEQPGDNTIVFLRCGVPVVILEEYAQKFMEEFLVYVDFTDD